MSNESDQPVRVTDKRGKQPEPSIENSAVIAGSIGAPVGGLFTDEVEGETTDEVMARVDRIQELRGKALDDTWTPEEREELLRLQGEQEEADKQASSEDSIDAVTAFLVIVYRDGSARATTDVNTMLTIDREANIDDMYGASSQVLRDIDATVTARNVVFGMQQGVQHLAERQRVMAAASALEAKGIDPRQMRRRR